MSMRASYLIPTIAAVSCLSTASVHGATLFSQTASTAAAYASDIDAGTAGERVADDFSVDAPATARSVTWRGLYGMGDTPTFPLSFDLTIYADNGGVPGEIVSNTSVTLEASEITDTGVDLLDTDVYEFHAELTQTLLLAGTTYWFSPQADTSSDSDDDWYWTAGAGHDIAAQKRSTANSGEWARTAYGPNYFVLEGSPVPEPASLALTGLGAVVLMYRRRRCERPCEG